MRNKILAGTKLVKQNVLHWHNFFIDHIGIHVSKWKCIFVALNALYDAERMICWSMYTKTKMSTSSAKSTEVSFHLVIVENFHVLYQSNLLAKLTN